MRKGYKIKYTYSSRDDIRGIKRYILDNFKYRELGENFTNLLFYIVDDTLSEVTILRVLQDGTNWQYILRCWISEQGENA